LLKEITLHTDSALFADQTTSRKQNPDENEKSFVGILKNAVNEVNQLQQEAEKGIQQLAAGNGKDIHQTMIAIEKAEISFQLMMQVRNKIVAAYEEIMRMQV
jgi:flagellar hook-basal body complex protein FliE